MRLPLILQIISSLCLITTMAALPISWSKHGCPEKCGNVTIPYPFGIGPECSANSSFVVICSNDTIPPKPILKSIDMEALSISVHGTARVKQPVSPMNCSKEQKTQSVGISLVGSPFTISNHYNSLVMLGCQNIVWLRANKTTTVGGCMAICEDTSTDTTCNGVNCCQTTLPPRLQEIQYTYRSFQSTNDSFCGYAFPTDKKWLREDYKRFKGLQSNLLNPFDQEFGYAPLVLEWELDDPLYFSNHASCRYPSRYFSSYSDSCSNPNLYSSYFFNENDYESPTKYCSCRHGFEGNPYIPGGCIDIDECSNATLNYCEGGTCINTFGSFTCQYSDNNIRSRVKIPLISIGSGLGALILLFGSWKSMKAITKRIKANRKRKFFKRNGGLLLEQHLSSSNNGLYKTKLFSSKELAQATDRYNENRILGCGGQGTVYKGMLIDGRIVAVKKSKRVDEGDLEVFINEVVILSQINHRNVVKLLGCCLETEVPLLVYEFIPNGTLFQHIHDPNEEFPLSWEMRLRIAREVAGALSYLHSAASTPIYHRDVKSTNILLDDKYRAKVSDFGTSRSVAIDQTHLTTRVLGTFGYLDPEYFQSSQFTEKSDVYSFGVVMVELLTGEKAISSVRAEVGRSLATHFLHSMEENHLFDILDARVLKEGKKEEIIAIAELARRCLHLNGKRRPTMKEVAVELEGIQGLKEGSILMQNHDENKEDHLIEIAESYDFSLISGSIHLDTTTACSPDVHQPLLDEP
ncbi:Serine/threonine protein kinase [Handroanthus impetiginosus]|uniref:Serine/threonine protein kinase n=1 Tax=Handroanthus impetiginosus TaxID=429701 RepID=A0A2G9GLP3_9LAMI|nr:Serine/threonine protein kinase [Handroanthus impetiginosus]